MVSRKKIPIKIKSGGSKQNAAVSALPPIPEEDAAERLPERRSASPEEERRPAYRKRPLSEDEDNETQYPEGEELTAEVRVREIARRPHRSPLLHWLALVLSVVSVVFPIWWLFNQAGGVPAGLLWADVALSLFFAGEFFTRSGFHWDPRGYALTHVFDFLAILPVMVFVSFNVSPVMLWVWLVLIMRVVRVLDRWLGDGFIQRNFLVLLNGIEEEISDRVLLKVISRMKTDLSRGKFGNELADALETHKGGILERVRREHPQRGIGVGLARLAGLDRRLEQIEEQIFESIVAFMRSRELDLAIREAIDNTFVAMEDEIKVKTWTKRLGFRYGGDKKIKNKVDGRRKNADQ